MSTGNLRVRRSLAALAGTDERKGYFYCLKMLGILPPPPGSGFDNWKFYTKAGMGSVAGQPGVLPQDVYEPKSLHDVLISSHATSCEHHSFYFSFYHRHIMILTEIFLNFAHRILKGGEQKLLAAYPSPEYNYLHKDHIEAWRAVFKQYAGLQGIPDEIADHYWNPTDYLSFDDLTVPEELRKKVINEQNPAEPIDALYQLINHAYPWELNVPTRWYNDPKLYNKNDLKRVFNSSPVVYSTDEIDFLNGNLDPRVHPNKFEEIVTIPGSGGLTNSKFMYQFDTNCDNMVLYRNFSQYDDVKRNYQLNNIQIRQSLAGYGAKSKNLQYINPAEQNQNQLSNDLVKNYNGNLPHYQFAYALFKADMKEFIQSPGSGVEWSHDYMHDKLRYILNDGSFSVTSLLFWPYHSWVDAEIEIKFRRANAEADHKSYDYFVTTLDEKLLPYPQESQLRNVFDQVFSQVSEKMGPMANWKISKDGQIQKQTYGRYPVTEWITPNIRQIPSAPPGQFLFSPAFCTRDLVLTKTNIRDSMHFNEIYQNYYAQFYQSRFQFFEGMSTFNYDYTYQIGSSKDDYDNLLDEKGENIPNYLKEMSSIWLAEEEPVVNALKSAFNQSIHPKSKNNRPHRQHHDLEHEDTEFLNIRKLFSSGIELYAAYPPDTKNGANPIYIRLKDVLKDLHTKLSDKDLQYLERYISHGLEVEGIFIFGKENLAIACHKCQKDKGVFKDLDYALRARAPQIWRQLHLSTLNEVYYDSRHPNHKPKCIFKKLSLVPNPKFSDYRLINGAEEVTIDVVSNILTKEGNRFLRVDAHSFSVSKDRIHTVLSKKYASFQERFDFYKIFDVDNENSAFFDRYVYKTLKGWVSIGAQRAKFEFAIPNFQRLLRLILHVDRIDGELHIKIEDADYQAKRVYYEHAVNKKIT